MQPIRSRFSVATPGPLAAAVIFTRAGSLGSPARADVTIEQRMAVSGPVRLANMIHRAARRSAEEHRGDARGAGSAAAGRFGRG